MANKTQANVIIHIFPKALAGVLIPDPKSLLPRSRARDISPSVNKTNANIINQQSLINRQSLRVSPEQLKVIIITIFGVEYMYDDVDEVEQYPSRLLVAGLAETMLALLSRGLADFIGYGAHLPVARAGGNHEIIGGRRYAPQVQNHNIGAMPLRR